MQQIYIANDPMHAHVLCGFLESHGVTAVVQGERIYENRPEVSVQYPTVWVSDDDAGKARELVLEYDAAQKEPARKADWKCPHCGELIEGSFSDCWKCAAQ